MPGRCWQIVANAGFPDDKLVRSGVARRPATNDRAARTRLCGVCAGSSQSSRPSSGYDAPHRFTGCDPADAHRWCRRGSPAAPDSAAPVAAAPGLRCSVGAASSAPIATACWATAIASVCAVHHPVRGDAGFAFAIDQHPVQRRAAAVYFGWRNEPCRLNTPFGARSDSSPSRLR